MHPQLTTLPLVALAFLGPLPSPLAGAPAPAAPCPLRLVDRLGDSGIDFRHRNGARGDKHLPETMGAGAAWIDYDGDGLVDLYLVQSGAFPPDRGEASANRLYRNRGDGRFVDVTAATGAGDRGYGQGTLAFDVDGDGDLDLWVGNYGPDVLLINDGAGHFASRALGLPGDPRNWSSSAAAADADGDGWLELYVARYLDYDPSHGLFCGEVGERSGAEVREYCDPSMFLGLADRFYRNHAGELREGAREAGLGAADGRGLGVVFTDLDGDHLPDLYVSNDLTLNLTFRNRGPGAAPQFEDVTLLSGAAVNRQGKPEAGMGVVAADLDQDGDPDLAVTNFDVETNTLYENLGGLLFDDVSARSGFGLPSFNRLGFGLVAADLDRDGALDLFVANGHIFEHPKRENITYRQQDQVLLGGQGAFHEAPCVLSGLRAAVGRGAASADYDLDGDVDLVVTNNDDVPFLLEDQPAVEPAAWLGVELVGAAPNTQAIGAELSLETPDGLERRWLIAGDSYQSSSERRLVLGVGAGAATEPVLDLRWPSGRRQRLVIPAPGRYLRIVEPPARGSQGPGANDAP